MASSCSSSCSHSLIPLAVRHRKRCLPASPNLNLTMATSLILQMDTLRLAGAGRGQGHTHPTCLSHLACVAALSEHPLAFVPGRRPRWEALHSPQLLCLSSAPTAQEVLPALHPGLTAPSRTTRPHLPPPSWSPSAPRPAPQSLWHAHVCEINLFNDFGSPASTWLPESRHLLCSQL